MNKEQRKVIKTNITTKLDKAEEYIDSINIMKDTLSSLKENGGETWILTYAGNNKEGCKVKLPVDLANKCFEIIIANYVKDVRQIREDVNILLDEIIKDFSINDDIDK